MNKDLLHQLDNPAWFGLTGPQASFSEGTVYAKRYKRENLPFLAFDHDHPEAIHKLNSLVRPGETFFLIGDLPELPKGWTVLKDLRCLQMIQQTPFAAQAGNVELLSLSSADRDDMYQLVQKVQPGYYEPDTYLLGQYFGIRQDGKLVAMAGERMRVNGLSEISAVCTDPGYTGKKFAQHLMVKLCDTQRAAGIVPFLHVLETNERAVKLYEYMGFESRRVISFWKLLKD